MKWLYVLSKFVYFPGSFLKALWEHLTCRNLQIPIADADAYFGKGYDCGHVQMLPPDSAKKCFAACLLPGIGNLLFGLPAFAAGCFALGYLGVDVIDPLTGSFCPLFPVYVLIYLFGASCLCSLFPRVRDAKHMWRSLYRKCGDASVAGKVFAFLPAGFLTAGAYLERSALPFLVSLGLLVYWIMT